MNTIDKICAQLASMKDNARSFIFGKDQKADAVCQADIEACEAATEILTALQDEGVNDPQEVRDLVHDYNALAEQYRKIHQKYEEPAETIRYGTAFLCPDYKRQIIGRYPCHYCSHCGKRIGRRKEHGKEI